MAYVALRWDDLPAPVIAEGLARGSLGSGLELRDVSDGWAIFADDTVGCSVIAGGRGVLLGHLFRKPPASSRIVPVDEILADGHPGAANRLGRDFWGRYVAFLRDPDAGAIEVCRDPSGGVPCFHVRRQDMDVVFSDLQLALRLGVAERRIDWGYVAHHIAYGGLRVARTGVLGVEEVLPGQVRRLRSGSAESRSFWRPADYAVRGLQIEDPDEARRVLFDTVEASVAALASTQTTIVLELSGGLDSSIIAMALRGRAGVVAVNCTTAGPEGDERRYARQVADAARLPLRECILEASAIDFRRRPTPWLARPGRTTVLQTIDARFADEGAELAASAFFNGTGGDSVFCYTNSSASAADRLLAHGPGLGFVRTALDIAALTGSTGWRVLGLALRIALVRPAPTPVRADLEHLAPEFWPGAPGPRPWMEGMERVAPGRRRHVEAITSLHGHVDGHDRNAVAPVIAPHAAQPVLEAVLRIPTWLWVAGGRDRAVAREAYAGLLPTDVFNRRSKGQINRYIVEAYNANRQVIEDLLANGALVAHGVVDMVAVRRTMATSINLDSPTFMRVIRLVDVELWAQGWLAPDVEPFF